MKRALALLLTVFTIACSDDDGSGPDTRIEGTYTLRTANGSNLPYTAIQDATGKLEILDAAS